MCGQCRVDDDTGPRLSMALDTCYDSQRLVSRGTCSIPTKYVAQSVDLQIAGLANIAGLSSDSTRITSSACRSRTLFAERCRPSAILHSEMSLTRNHKVGSMLDEDIACLMNMRHNKYCFPFFQQRKTGCWMEDCQKGSLFGRFATLSAAFKGTGKKLPHF